MVKRKPTLQDIQDATAEALQIKTDDKLGTMTSTEHLYKKYGNYFWFREDCDKILKEAENELKEEETKHG